MKYLCALILFCAGGLFAAIPDSAEGWYTPDNYSFEGVDATWEDSKGNKWGASVDRQGNVIWSGIPADPDLKNALEYALSAYATSKFNQDKIQKLGENLHKVFSTDGITISGETPDGTVQSYTIRFKSGIGESGTIQGETEHMKWNLADEKSLEMLKGNKVQIKGWGYADDKINLWDHNVGALMMRLTPGDSEGVVYLPWYGVDKLSLAPSSSSKKLQLSQWDTAPNNGMLPLAEALAKERKDGWSNYKLVVRNSSKELKYVDIGTLPIGGGSPVDGTSITTNTSAGASVQGEASLYGWSTADDMGLPFKSDGKLKWKTPDEWVDGSSLAFADVDGEKKFEVKNAHMYAGKHSKHYFGTGSDKSAPLGWHELPNTSTNRVEGDERTISSNPNIPGKNPDPEVKTLGLIGWNYTYSGQDPLFMVNRGGALDYMPLPAITNLAACACTNKWQSLLGWVEDGELSEDGIKFEYPTLDEYLYNGLGYIYSTTPDNLHFNNDGDTIKASFTAPENWADGLSLNLTEDGKYQIKDFATAGACSATVSKMLSEPKGSDATTHLLLAKKTDDGSLHYVPFGEGIAGGGEHADGVTIVTNTAAGAVELGLLSLYGFASAKDGKVLTKKDGKVAWEDGGIPADEITLAATEDKDGNKKLGIKGFEAAAKNSIPWKNEEGEFVWGGASTVTNRILAGAGINITDNGGGAITISAQKLMEDSAGAASEKVLTVITDMRYDAETHKFQCKRRQIRLTGSFVGDDPEWEDVFEATSHKEEHSSGN